MNQRLQLDPTPSGAEESADLPDIRRVRGDAFNPSEAKSRIDKIARWLAVVWTIFLAYIILIQGFNRTISFVLFDLYIPIFPKFHLEQGEFIAVVTTTTASVFGFLVIISRGLFKSGE